MSIISDFPAQIAARTAGKPCTIDHVGLSGSSVLIYDDMVLKREPLSEESENQTAMLRWLEGKLPVPQILESVIENGFRWTLMTRIPGDMACAEANRQDLRALVRALADGLKALWNVDISDCPVDQSPQAKLRRAERIVEAGQVDMELAEPDTFGKEGFSSPSTLLKWLREHAPECDPVLTHGDLCLPNVFLMDGKITGFLDLGRSGAGDRWTDIAICWRSLRDNFGGHYGEAVPGFHPDELFDALGIQKDEEKLRYYLLMDELF